MATASSTMRAHLVCSICTEIYTDPVSLSCEHIFCKTCLQQSLEAGHQQCPECRQPIRERHFQINRVIRNLADQARVDEGRADEGRAGRDGAKGADVCIEHREILQLFCETDGQLVCYICRDGRQHRGHSFKPVKEAQDDLKQEVALVLLAIHKEMAVDKTTCEEQANLTFEKKEKSERLKYKIKAQFEEVIAKLRETEETVMRQVDEQSGLATMEKSLAAMERHLTAAEERNATLESGQMITDPREFLQWWRERGRGLCNSKSECLQVYTPRQVYTPHSFTRRQVDKRSTLLTPSLEDRSPKEDIDYDSLLGCIKWDYIDKNFRGNLAGLYSPPQLALYGSSSIEEIRSLLAQFKTGSQDGVLIGNTDKDTYLSKKYKIQRPQSHLPWKK